VTAAPTAPAGDDTGENSTSHQVPFARHNLGWIVAGPLFIGLVAALLLPLAPFVPAEESNLTGALLCGFALGWAGLAVLSARYSDQPQPWAMAPALFMGLGGLLLLSFGSAVQGVLKWLWPPALLVLAVWMIIRSRQQLRSGGRWLLYPVFGVLLLASVGGVYETVGGSLDASPYPMHGELIDVGGHSLHLYCTGTGSPTVVLEPGGGLMSSALGWIAPAAAADTRVCIYDRAGRGWSDPADSVQDATQIATDLHTLLDRGQVPGPYVLAGHSFGGRYVLTFAALYPDEVAGMVLVDSTAPARETTGEPAAGKPPASYNLMGRVSALLSASARVGFGRLLAQADYGGLPPQSRDEQRASAATADYVQSTIDEYLQADASGREAAALVSFADAPLVVLTAGVGSDAAWLASQDRLAALSSDSEHRFVDGTDHAGLLFDEQGAEATTEAILDVVSSIRNGVALVG
jgi:pimeloyl-ACP methyl ester carboxylesterase